MLLVDAYRDAFLFERDYENQELRVLIKLDELVSSPYIQIKFIDYLCDADQGGAGTELDYVIIDNEVFLKFSTGISKDKPNEDLILDLATLWDEVLTT